MFASQYAKPIFFERIGCFDLAYSTSFTPIESHLMRIVKIAKI